MFMEPPTDSRGLSRDHRYGRPVDRAASPCIRQGTKLRDMLMSEKPNLSYARFHDDITRVPDVALPRHTDGRQSEMSDRMSLKEDEVVRYMSKLPSYLEKGKNYQEKALNVGVIDWKRLEKWQYNQKVMPHKYTGYSPSSSSTTDGSSTRSSRSQNDPSACQRMPAFSPQSPLEVSLKERHVSGAKPSGIRGHNCFPSHQIPDYPVLQSHSQKAHAREGKPRDIDIFRGNARLSRVHAGSTDPKQPKVFETFQGYEKKESDMKSALVVAPCKGKTKIHASKSAEETQMLQETKLNATCRDYSEREKSVITIKPKDQLESSCSGATILSDSTAHGQSPVQPNWEIIPGKNNCEDTSSSESDSSKHSAVKYSSQASSHHHTKMFDSPSKITAQGAKTPQASYLLPFPARRFTSPSRSRNTEEKKPIAGLRVVSAATSSSDELDVRKSSESFPKARNPSPIRRLSFAMSKMIKNVGSRENSPLRRSSSTECVTKPVSEGARASVSMDHHPGNERSSSNSRGRSSPLRRLFDPLLKSRASGCPEPSKKSSHEPSDPGPRHSVKLKSRGANTKTESPIQALLQVSFKNGLPLFTFAIDSESNILAATVRKSYVPGKGHYSWAYTFFTVREVKRKSGIWLNQGSKIDAHGYVPNVVAQMKVSDTPGSPFGKHENPDSDITREFDLFAVDVGHGDQHGADFHPTNELAAIVVKLPRVTCGSPSKDGQSTYSWLDSSQPFYRVNCTISDKILQNHQGLQTPNFPTTVILPGGVHTIPSRGEISTLAQRWKSGGSCDCGGWDLGCQLRVYASRGEYEWKTGSSATHPYDQKFLLFSQVGQDNQLMLSVSPFKERIYSVEFNPSLSLLQAFAICISHIDCRRPADLSEPGIAVDKLSNEVGVFELPVQMKTSTYQGEVPARYVSYPPHSPVGRV